MTLPKWSHRRRRSGHRPHCATSARSYVDAGRLLPYHRPIAIADCRVDHRVADDLQQEQVTLADDLLGQREDISNNCFGQSRSTGGNPPYDRDAGRCGSLVSPGEFR